ncbi:glycolate oxidase subunit GlcE [Sulfuriferula thiophila]|uniref:glycolate oxidase subunit GlcE n=1 Tax=Sulfuriferula thiophila TaxID=1781211 RepID=UPI000F609785|nr:glycolate oxidase subunit GlcE [Sulfuriferula thiophila]
MAENDLTVTLQQQVQAAYADKTPLNIVGGNSKAFYGRQISGSRLDMSGHRGIISYEPTELVLTARAGTPLVEIEQALATQGQMLAFEPPHWGPGATLGGTVACNLSGPRRPYAGSARDFVLGCRVINGKGELLKFGAEVMKNVAGYDAARLMTGALGTLGVLLDISLKVLPAPQQDLTLIQSCTLAEALNRMNRLAAQPLPLSASAWVDGHLYLRFSGADSAVAAVKAREAGDVLADAAAFWHSLRELNLPFFAGTEKLWRIALPQTAAQPELPGDWLVEWGGAQRWLRSTAAEDDVRTQVAGLGGHAALIHGGDRAGTVFQPLPAGLWQLHQRLKLAFDPAGILNPGRMYEGL